MPQPDQVSRTRQEPKDHAVQEAFGNSVSIGVVGDIILNKRCRHFRDEPFRTLVDTLHTCDAVLGNLEGLYHDWEMPYGSNYNPYPIVAEAAMLEEVQWLGMSAVSAANNHAYDCGEAGLLATLDNCRKLGLPAAGAGRSIGDARAPVFVETNGGRVALLGGTTTFGLPDLSHAGPPGVGILAKPGVAAIRHHTVHTVPTEVFDALQAADRALSAFPASPVGEFAAFGGRVTRGEGFSTRTSCHLDDLQEIGRSIRAAKAVSDIVVYSVHCHENGQAGELFNALHKTSVPNFLKELAKYCIDQGCDVFFGHGPHILRGMEIHKGKPIFYSLSDFFFQPETVRKVPPPGFAAVKRPEQDGAGAWGHAFLNEPPYAWGQERRCYQGVVPICDFRGGELTGIRLVPVELGRNASHSHRGRPAIARGEEADDILAQLRTLSAEFGTEIGDGAGFIHLVRS